jgi:molybdopterin-guanine dinucleotide biosynthesis protein B
MGDVLTFIGFSNSGKTAVVSNLVSYFSKKGYKIGVIKHTSKDFLIDREGKDSWRIYSAGADVVVLSPVKMTFVKHLSGELSLDELGEFFSDYDLVLAEGFKGEFKQAIAVVKNVEDLNEILRAVEVERGSTDGLLAVVGEISENVKGLRVFRPSQIEELAEFVGSLFGMD